ncbi:MAG: tetratricopeptide repeat protein [Pseudomonadota bacterium]
MMSQARQLPVLLFFCLATAFVCGPVAAFEVAAPKVTPGATAIGAPALYTQAMQSIDGDEGEYPEKVLKGVASLAKLAEQGYAPAQFMLGYYFHTGPNSYDCLVQAPEKAYYWYGKAAEQNHLKAQYELAMLFNPETGFARFANREKYLFWMNKAASLGYSDAQAQLGHMYEKGDAVQADPAIARQWYEKAARQGNKLAASRLKKMPG